MFCFHKFDPEIKDGYQFCKKCGKAVPVDCSHVWKTIKERKMIRNYEEEVIEYHQQCEKCGSLQCRTY